MGTLFHPYNTSRNFKLNQNTPVEEMGCQSPLMTSSSQQTSAVKERAGNIDEPKRHCHGSLRFYRSRQR